MSRRLFHGQLADDIAGEDRQRAERLRLLARSLVDIVRDALIRDGVVRIHGFGTFRLSRVRARRGINPQTGEPIDIPARNRVLFRPSKALRDRVEPEHPAAVPLAEPHESREAWLGGVMSDSPVAGSLPAPDNQRRERSYFPDRVTTTRAPDRVAAATMEDPTARVSGSAHPPVREGGSREATLGGAMGDSPSAGRVVLRPPPEDAAPTEPPPAPPTASRTATPDAPARGSREARLGTSGEVWARGAGALPAEDAGPEVQEPGRPATLPVTQEGPSVPSPPAQSTVDHGGGSREAALGGEATRVAPAGGLPEEGAPDVESSQDWVADGETGRDDSTRALEDDDWDVPRLTAPGEEQEAERDSEEPPSRGPILLLGLLLLLLLLGLVGWWLWPAGAPTPRSTPVAEGEIERGQDTATEAPAGEDSTAAGAATAEEAAAESATESAPAAEESATEEAAPAEPAAEEEPAATATAEAEPVEAEPAEAEPVEPEAVEPEAVEPETVEAETVEAETVEAEPLEAEPAEAEAVEAEPVEAESAEPAVAEAEPSEPVAVEAGAAESAAAGAEDSAAATGELGAGTAAGEPADATTGGASETTAREVGQSAVEVAEAEAATAGTAQATEPGAGTAEGPWFSSRDYTVARGDTLWDLSDVHYVNPYYWPHIWNHNPALANPDRIEIDQVLLLPALEGEPRNLSAADRRSIAEGYLSLYRLWRRTDAGNPEYALIGVRYFDPEVMPPALRNDPAAGLPNDALAAAFAALLEAEFPPQPR